jgi:ABC-type branched-subunit amino acid transport system ATPase component
MTSLTLSRAFALSLETTTTSPVILRTHSISKAFGGQKVLSDVSLQLRRGEVVLLRGDNGSGKTTLLNTLSGNLEPDSGTIELSADGTEERFTFPRRWWKTLNPFDHFTPDRVAREGVGRTWQEIRLFSTMNLHNNIAVASPGQLGENPLLALVKNSAVRKQENDNLSIAQDMLTQLGLGTRGTAAADRISLGQSKRVAISRAVRAGGQILFLDEPLAGLDGAGISQVLRMLEVLVRDQNITLIIVEHVFNIPLLLTWATTVWTLKRGRIEVQAPEAVQEEVQSDIGTGLRSWITEIAGTDGRINDRPVVGGAMLSTVVPSGRQPGNVVLEVSDLVVYRGNRLIIGHDHDGRTEGLSFSLREGDVALLQAPNGWGKSTLLEAIAGLTPISSGEIRLRGRSIKSMTPWARAESGLTLLQSRNHAFPNLTVKEALNLTGHVELPDNLHRLLARKMSDLSGGEKQKVAIYSSLRMDQSRVRLFDEPLGMLDRASIHELQQAFKPGVGEAFLIAVPGSPEILGVD